MRSSVVDVRHEYPRALLFPRAAVRHYDARYEFVLRSFGSKLMSRGDGSRVTYPCFAWPSIGTQQLHQQSSR
jgi:hypothetical protein